MKTLSLFFALYFPVLAISYAQPPARLKQVVTKRFDNPSSGLVTWDSTVYYYSGNNRGHLTNELFFNAFGVNLYGTPGVPWVKFAGNPASPHLLPVDDLQYDSLMLYLCHPTTGVIQHYRNNQDIANGHVTKYTNEEYMPATNKWEIRRTEQFTYQNNLLTSRRYGPGGGWSDTVGYRYVINSNNLVDSLILTYNIGGVTVYTYSYNSNNQVSEVNSFLTLSRHDKTVFDYNTAGLLTNSTTLTYNIQNSVWDTLYAFDYGYNTGNQRTRQEYREINALTFQGMKTLYTLDIQYDNNNNRVEDIFHYDYYKHGSVAGLIKVARKSYNYNSFGLIGEYEVQHWDDTALAWGYSADSVFGPSQKVQLDYELFWSQDISTINPANRGLTIFPSPASGFITIKAEDMPTGNLEAIIYDMQGRTLRKWVDKSDGTYLRTIPVQELPSGTYFLQLTGKDISRNTQFVIYR